MPHSPPVDGGTTTDEEQDLAIRIKKQAANSNRPSSIDMALRLERQLEAEHDHEYEHELEAIENKIGASSRPISLDPVVLSTIVANLRTDFARVVQERDALTEQLANAPTREAELREAMALLTERCTDLENEVATLRKKNQDDDDAIQMLRTKVEESRRGLMRLQTESKRMSQISIDSGRANAFFGVGPPSSKRASFAPLTGSGAGRINAHRRISSVSDSFALGDMGADPALLLLSPNSRTGSHATSPSPPMSMDSMTSETESISENFSSQIEALRRERDLAFSEIINAKRELCEAQEARDASEQCITALRAFISEHGIGDSSNSGDNPGACRILKLPPLPTERDIGLDGEQKPTWSSMSTGWSFGKLWRTDSTGVSSSPSSCRTSSTTSVITTSDISSSVAPTLPKAAAVNPSPSTPTASFSRKLGGFFSRASSVASIGDASLIASVALPRTPLSPLMVQEQQVPTLNGSGSDGEESLETDDGPLEPVSPSRESSHDVTCTGNVVVSSTSLVSSNEIGLKVSQDS